MTSPAEPFLATWSRRAVTVPVALLLGSAALVTAPLWAAVGLAWDALAGAARTLPRTRALAFFALYLGCEAFGVLAAAALWISTLGGRTCGPGGWIERNAALQRRWVDALFFGSRRIFSMKVSTEGLSLADEAPFLVFARHASVADTVLAAAFVANPRRLLLRYVLKRELLWDPCLDIVGRRLPNAFVRRRGPGLDGEVAAIAALARGLDARSGVLMYPEGRRFTGPRRAAAVAALEAQGESELAGIAAGFRNVLPPRRRGALALLDAAAGVDLVLLEHTGFEGASTFPSFWRGALVGGALHVRLRRIPASSIPRESRDRWLFERWIEMDRWISETGEVDSPERSGP